MPRSACLELGSGLGLPALLLTEVKRQLRHAQRSRESAEVILTDYEDLLLENLVDSIRGQFEEEEVEEEEEKEEGGGGGGGGGWWRLTPA